MSGARSCLNPCLVCRVSRPDQPLSSYYIDALALRLSPHPRTSAVTIPRQLAPTVGLAHGGVEFLEGFFPGFREIHGFQMKQSRIASMCIVTCHQAIRHGRITFRCTVVRSQGQKGFYQYVSKSSNYGCFDLIWQVAAVASCIPLSPRQRLQHK